jgi:hypothetical protein
MSARLNMNQTPLVSWKGKTFNQISSKIQLNNRTETESNNLLFKALPLQIYRREIVTSDSSSCNTRLSSSIDLLNTPNGSIINSKAENNHNGLENTLDINLTENKTERFDCNTSAQCFNPAKNALRRLRSGGMIKRQYDVSKNNDTYATSTNQYLVSRNRTFQQNQYNYIKKGDAMVIPGDALSKQNIYAGSGTNHCQKYYLPEDTYFQYQWFESYDETTNNVTTHYGPQTYTVDLSAGYYSIEDINATFKSVMTTNLHYLESIANKSKIFFMNFAYNTFSDKVELQIQNISESIFSPQNYILPLQIDKDARVDKWSVPEYISFTPVVIINDNVFKSVIGFESSRYPNYMFTDEGVTETTTNTSNVSTTTTIYEEGYLRQYDVEKTATIQAGYYELDDSGLIRTPMTDPSGTAPFAKNSYEFHVVVFVSTISVFSSTNKAEIKPLYTPLYYKPNNPKFAQQGGVSSSSLISRKKYDTITCNTEVYRSAYGLQVANAMAYGVPANGYTVKDKIGYPMTKTPVFSKYSDEVRSCTAKTFNG